MRTYFMVMKLVQLEKRYAATTLRTQTDWVNRSITMLRLACGRAAGKRRLLYFNEGTIQVKNLQIYKTPIKKLYC